MGAIQTNRDLYVAIADLINRHRNYERTLEEYLRALWAAAGSYRSRSSLSVDEFFSLLSEAFILPTPLFDEAWCSRYEEDFTDVRGFYGWEARVLRQIVDLHEMGERGMLDDELLYFGIDSPRGQRWYNFDPCTFLECATAGSCGGWQPGDETGRDYVPGPVVILGDDDRLKVCDPRDVPTPVFSLCEVNWDDFRMFLGYAQCYE